MKRWVRVVALPLCLFFVGCAAQAARTATSTPLPCPFSNATPNPDATPSALEVVRLYAVPNGLPEFRRCVQHAAGVQRLYAAILALPAKGNRPYACAKGSGSDYYLTFLAGSNVVRMMTMETGGCRFLSLSEMDVRLTEDTFQQEFAALAGL